MTVLSILLLMGWISSAFFSLAVVRDGAGLSLSHGRLTYWPGEKRSDGWYFNAANFELDNYVGAMLLPGMPFGVAAPLWVAALPVGAVAAWMWDARRRRRIGLGRWLLTLATIAGGFLWWTSRWTMYGAGGPHARVTIIDGRIVAHSEPLLEGRRWRHFCTWRPTAAAAKRPLTRLSRGG